MSDKETFVIDDPAAQGWTDSGTTAGGSPVWNWDEDTDAIREAPIDGSQYARQDADWSEVVIPEGGENYWSKVAVIGGNPLGTIGVNYSLDAYSSARVFHADTVNERMIVFADKAEFTETVQATDYLDAEGNSIVGAGGGSPWTELGADIYFDNGTVHIGQVPLMETGKKGLAVGGDINASGTVSAGKLEAAGWMRTDNGNSVGMFMDSRGLIPCNPDFSFKDDVNIGDASAKFKDAHFSGTVSATTEFTSGSNWANDATASMRLSSANGLFTKNPAVNHLTCYSGGTANANVVASISKDGNATFSGAAQFDTDVNVDGTVSPNLMRIKGNDESGYAQFSFGSFNAPVGAHFTAQASGVFQIKTGAPKAGDASERMRIEIDGSTTFLGNVDAAGFTINGEPIGGGSSGNHQGAGGGDVYADRGSNMGAVYFGTPASQYLFYNGSSFQFVGGEVSAYNFRATSDERLKENISTAPVGLIDSLNGREWDWKESGEKGSGVVAQELEQILPHLVHTDDEGMKSVAYNGLIAYLIEELKDCRERLAVLEAKD